MDELIAFLRARINEERDATERAYYDEHDDGVWRAYDAITRADGANIAGRGITIYAEGGHTTGQAEHIARWCPARITAELEAKEQILAECEQRWRESDRLGEPSSILAGGVLATLRILVRVWRGHPDFQQHWLADYS